MAVELLVNTFSTTLAGAATASDATIQVNAAAPAAAQNGQFRVLIGSEVMLVTGGQNGTTWNVTRGVDGTVGVSHVVNTIVQAVFTASGMANWLLTNPGNLPTNILKYLQPSGGDDTSAITGAGKRVALDEGVFNITSGLVLSQATRLAGSGEADFSWGGVHTELDYNNTTGDALTIQQAAAGSILKEFALRNTAAGAPTAGYGINCMLSQASWRMEDLHVRGFYDGMLLGGRGFRARSLTVSGTVRHGIVVGNISGDNGLGFLTETMLYAGPTQSPSDAQGSGLVWQNGGGFRVNDLKIGSYGPSPLDATAHTWYNGILFAPVAGVSSGEVIMNNIVCDVFTNAGLAYQPPVGGGSLTDFTLNGFKINNSNATCVYGINLDGTNGTLSNAHIASGILSLHSSPNLVAGINVAHVNNLQINDVVFLGVPPTVPLISLGAGVTAYSIKLGLTSYQSGASAVTPATGSTFILSGQSLNTIYGGAASGSCDLTVGWNMPALAANPTWTHLWQFIITNGTALMVELFYQFRDSTNNATYSFWRKRMLSVNPTAPNAITATVIGTDTDSVANILDFQLATAGSTAYLDVRPHTGWAGTVTAGFSIIKILGAPNTLLAYA